MRGTAKKERVERQVRKEGKKDGRIERAGRHVTVLATWILLIGSVTIKYKNRK